MAESSFVHFQISGDRLAVLLEEIREVARVSRVTPVPRAPSAVRGVANIRGRVITLLDLDVLYGRPENPPSGAGHGHAVVLAAPRDNLALFTRSRVDIGRGEASAIAGEPPGGAPGRDASDPARAPLGPLVSFRGEVIHLLPTAEIAAHCEARVLSRYRHR